MRFSLLIDRILRVSAILTALVGFPIALMMGAFAADSGTVVASALGLVLLVAAGLLLLGVIILALKFRRASTPAGGGQRWYWAACVYAVGAAGLVIAAKQILDTYRTGAHFQEVKASDPNYPALNQQSSWTLRVSGTLPVYQPIDHLEADYIVEAASPECRTDGSHGELPLQSQPDSVRIQDAAQHQKSWAEFQVDGQNPEWRCPQDRMRMADESHRAAEMTPHVFLSIASTLLTEQGFPPLHRRAQPGVFRGGGWLPARVRRVVPVRA